MLRTVLICAVILSATEAARILGVFMTPSYSHQVVFQPIWKELSLRGHQVKVLTPNPLNDPTLTNLTEIDLSGSYEAWNNQSIATLGMRAHSISEEMRQLTRAYFAVGEAQLAHPEVQELIRSQDEHFDLILVEFLFPLMYAFKDRFGCPMVGITSLGLTGVGYDSIGNPNHPALHPAISLPFSTQLSFKERVFSTAFHLLYKFGVGYTVYPKVNALAKRHFGGGVRNVEQIGQDVSLVIMNGNRLLQDVRPLVPALVEIAGIHIRPRRPLPADLRAYLDKAKEGVVYFSLGSNVKSNLLPKEKLQKLMKVFAELPYKVLWKYEDDNLPIAKPSNVEIRKWLPQQDVLGHPNVRLFITQGGVQSLDESIFNKVPVLVMPFFGDQRYNAHRATHVGAGLSIDFHSFTADELREKVLQLIRNPHYQKRVNQLALITADHQTPALEKAVWWIEYVIRHDGAPHLRYAAVDMPFYQYYLLDVAAFAAAVIAFVLYTLLRILKHVVVCYRVVLKLLVSMNIYKRRKSHVD